MCWHDRTSPRRAYFYPADHRPTAILDLKVFSRFLIQKTPRPILLSDFRETCVRYTFTFARPLTASDLAHIESGRAIFVSYETPRCLTVAE